jgi:NTE family protein
MQPAQSLQRGWGLAQDVRTFFDGVPAEELEPLLGRLERRHVEHGSIVVAEGDAPQELYVVRSGSAEVLVADGRGERRRVGHVAAGATLCEMSLFTGEPASATVRATSDLELLVLGAAEFERLADRFPVVYRNLGSILSQRLAVTSRLAARDRLGELTLLEEGGTPTSAWALACSLAWHTRRPTALAVVGAVPLELEPLARERADSGADIAVLTDADVGRLRVHLTELRSRYDHVLLYGPAPDVLREVAATVALDGLPRLEHEDEHALRTRVLPATTPAGRVVGRVARDIGRLRVGLALGAGSQRGYAHFGVLRALDRLGLVPDVLAGTSVGGAAATLAALGHDPDAAAALFDRAAGVLVRPTIPRHGLFSSRALRHFYRQVAGDRLLEELPVPLGLVTADLLSGREVVLRRGPVWQAVLATCSIPGIYPPQPVGPYLLVDGGIVEPVPVAAAVSLGADVVVAVKLVGAEPPLERDGEAVPGAARAPSPVGAILRSLELMQSRLGIQPEGATVVTVDVDLTDARSGRLRRFADGRGYIETGESALEAASQRLAAALPWLR